MKILHLITSFDVGGIERWLVGILPYIDQEKYEMDFFCRSNSPGVLSEQVRAQGCKVFVNTSHQLNMVVYLKQLEQLLKDNNYDLVQNHMAHHGGLPARKYAKLGLRSIASFHNARLAPLQFGNGLKRFLSRIYTKHSLNKMVSEADIITGCSKDVVASIGDLVSFENKNVEVLNYGVEVHNEFSIEQKRAIKRKIDVSEEKHLVIHVGRFNPQKNHLGFLEIAKMVLEKRDDVNFILLGEGDTRPSVEEKSKSLGIDSAVKFLGLRSDVEDLLLSSDVFLFPSLFEGLPVACLEAMAAGLPVLGSDVPGIKLLVKNNETGYLIDKDNLVEFAEKLNLLLDNEKLRNEMGGQARAVISNDFSYKRSADKLMKCYEALKNK